MKKVGILTFHRAINYGAVLQAYALQSKVMDLGFDAEIIDYGAIGVLDESPIKKNVFQRIFDYIVGPVSRFRHLMRRVEVLLILRVENRLFRKDIEKQAAAFSEFERDQLNISENSYHAGQDLEGVELHYNGIITGSDQVWNPLITQCDLAYFLNFIDDNNKKISYAPSFGNENIPEDFKGKIVHELKNIKCLSVRETAGAEIIKNISGRDAQVVVDPTLLLSSEEWQRIIPEAKINEPYIFCYALLGNAEISRLCRRLSSITGFKIVRVSLYHTEFQRTKEYFDGSTTYVNDAGPLEFLSYLNNASLVVTNSFHGTVFSINFKKDFYVLPPEHSIVRILNMLSLYGLNDRLIGNGVKLPDENDISIDYSNVETVIKCERNRSIEFLKESLNGL